MDNFMPINLTIWIKMEIPEGHALLQFTQKERANSCMSIKEVEFVKSLAIILQAQSAT